uniref:GATA zinc finger domain containing 2A n=1 Tax=Sinocyclocheilus grahami TaxID=75366 RepID=A0A672LG29_SINGR
YLFISHTHTALLTCALFTDRLNCGLSLCSLVMCWCVQVMSEDAVRQTRSQKRALEQESPQLKLDGSRSVQDSSVLKTTIKVELQTRDEPMDTKCGCECAAVVGQVISAWASGTVIPPPLSKHSARIIMPPLLRGAQVPSLRQQQNSSGPPPLLLAPRATLSSVPGHKIIQPGLIRMTSIPSTGLLLSISQAAGSNLKSGSGMSNAGQAAKLALRKQLEKTLLEIPPPKPSSPQLTFVPSAASNEFIYLLGLEEVVQNLLQSLGRGADQQSESASHSAQPSCCSQCQTDFTCCWRRDEGGAVMCEQCMSSNQKKLLKAEHTNRLKVAFVKALQQEREIDQRVLQHATPPASSSSSSSAHRMKADQVKARSSSSAQTVSRSAAVSQSASARSVQPSAIRVVPHVFSPSSQLQNAVAAAALVSRPGKHAERQGSKVSSSSARKRSSSAAGVTMAYVNPSLSVQKPVERHREYLLDMISSRSVSQTANSWK